MQTICGQKKPDLGRMLDRWITPELIAFEFEAMRLLAVHPATYHIPSSIGFPAQGYCLRETQGYWLRERSAGTHCSD